MLLGYDMKLYHVYSPISYFFILPYRCLASSCIRPENLWSWKIYKSYYQSPKRPLKKEKRRREEKKIRTKWTNSCYWKFKYLEFHNIITTGKFSIVRRLVRLFKQYATIKWCRHNARFPTIEIFTLISVVLEGKRTVSDGRISSH